MGAAKDFPDDWAISAWCRYSPIVYNELVTNAVALQTVVDQIQALHTLKSNGINIRTSDLAFLSPYATSKLKRFGDYPTDLKPEAMPICTALPQ